MKLNTPLRVLVSRHTRELLRRYHAAGKLKTPIATRQVEDRFVEMTEAERHVYEQVEDYIGSTYNNAAADERTALGFVMTIYRRRLASSFYALIKTLDRRLASVGDQMTKGQDASLAIDEDIPDDELDDEVLDTDQAADLEQRALALEEAGDIRGLLAAAKRLPHDTKADVLLDLLRELREQGYKQVMVFTQYTDTMDFLRGRIAETRGAGVICFSGRGGEVPTPGGDWQVISRESTKQRFREGRAEVMVFQSFVGRLQPILARLPRAITDVSLGRTEDRDRARANLVADIESGLTSAERAGFDLDEVTVEELDEPPRPPAAFGLAELGALLGRPELLPPGVVSRVLGSRDWSWLAPGMAGPVRVTTDPDYFEQHPDSTELGSPGSPLFPLPEPIASPQELEGLDWCCLTQAG